MVQGGMSVVKFLLFVFNFIFVACGIALIAVGVVAQKSSREYTVFLNTKFVTAPVIIITLGCIIFFIAFLGCCGAVRQNYCMVMTFGILLFLIFIIEISSAIAAYVYRNELDQLIQKNMEDALSQNKSDVLRIWNDLEVHLHCCGINSSDDYLKYNMTVPDTCCGKEVRKDGCTDPYKDGCFEKLLDLFHSKLTVIGGVGIGIAFVEILGMVFAWCLASAIKKEYEGV